VMRELEGRSYLEIADTLGVSLAAVETLIFRARRSLRLRASALRSLGAVPVPASLAPLFEGGGLMAGGGGLLGTGFIIKAAVVLVAGAIVTGIVADPRKHTVASPRPHFARASLPDAQDSPAAERVVRRAAKGGTASRVRPGLHRTDPAAPSVTRASLSRPVSGDVGRPAPAPTAPTPVPSPTQPVDQAVDTVETTISSTVSAVPVPAPAIPPLPVQTPPLPGLP